MKKYFPAIRRLSLVPLVLFLPCLAPAHAESGKVLYQSDFAKTELSLVPKDFLVLDGDFAVKESEGRKVLELPLLAFYLVPRPIPASASAPAFTARPRDGAPPASALASTAWTASN
jgi:hypothetical protein